MEDWSKDLLVAIEDVANGVEKFFTDLSEEFAQVVDEWEDLSAEISRELEHELENDHLFNQINQYLTELLAPIVELYADLDAEENNFDQNFVTYVEPDQQTHPACQGCENYHGQVYGGNLLVCAMHPHGVESETCPDWSDRN